MRSLHSWMTRKFLVLFIIGLQIVPLAKTVGIDVSTMKAGSATEDLKTSWVERHRGPGFL